MKASLFHLSVLSGKLSFIMFKRFALSEDECKSSVRPFKPSSQDTVTSATGTSCTSHTADDDQISFVSAITLDDALGVSDRMTISDRYQYRLDPRLHSLQETKRASGSDVEQRSITVTNTNRFSSVSEGGETQLCPKPRRKLSMSYRSAYSNSLDSVLSTPNSSLVSLVERGDHEESGPNGELDLLHASGASSLSYCQRPSSSELDYRTSASSDLDYRSSDHGDISKSSFFLEEENLDVNEYDQSSSSFEEPLAGVLDGPEYDLPLGGESETKLPISQHQDTAPRRNYHSKVKSTSPVYGYSRSGVSSQSLDLLDVFGDKCRSH